MRDQGKRRSVYRSAPEPGVNLRLRVERLAWGGVGLARSEDGRLILLRAPLALFPGETVDAEVRWKPRHGEGKVLRWVDTSPRRQDPSCRAAMTCGGCDLQGAPDRGSSLKKEMVEDLFHRSLPGAPAWTWHAAPTDARRHRIQLHWDGKELGFHERGSHRLVAVTACPAATEVLSLAIPRLREALVERVLPTGPARWELATGTPASEIFATDSAGRTWKLLPHGFVPLRPPDPGLRHTHRDLSLRHGAGGFFQVCAPWAMAAFDRVLSGWNLKGGTLYDLYGGVGLFSALLGDRFQHRVLVEGFEPALAWARLNLEGAGLASECLAADVAEWLPERLGQPGDLLLLDPPRTGLDPAVAERLNLAGADGLVLVGCDGAAFCRDVARLSAAWTLKDLAVLDLFPGTSHVECVGRFHRKA